MDLRAAPRRQEALNAEAAYFRAHPEDTHREWLLQAIEHLRRTPATAALVDARSALWTVSPSGRAATELLGFWRETTESGDLVRNFADPTLDTRFLGDLYQDLSDYAKKTYALLQTPDFVEEFILDRTLEPALAERPLEGFKLIDPACGSGHFLLGAFARLLDRWQRHAPGLEPRDRVQRALDAVWGVNINPFAVAIARFRLLLAALDAVGATSLEGAPGFDVHVLTGDSLYFSHDQDALFTTGDDFAYENENKDILVAALTRGQYDAVVANPPYIMVKDARLNAAHRERYNYVKGKYSLTAPFMELLFKLAKPQLGDSMPGWVGQITSNAFMKRDFGVPVIEGLLTHLDLRLVIDTSGAYIPGHGTPTVILVGRNAVPEQSMVRVIMGVRGEPGRPSRPESGLVWTSISDRLDEAGYGDTWVTVADLPRESLMKHPWSLMGGGAPAVSEAIRVATVEPLSVKTDSIGITAFTLADDAYIAPRRSFETRSVNSEWIRGFITGESLRDWGVNDCDAIAFPYNADLEALDLDGMNEILHWLWPNRTVLANSVLFGRQTKREAGLRWSEYGRFTRAKLKNHLSIGFAFVATHNHFVLDRGVSLCFSSSCEGLWRRVGGPVGLAVFEHGEQDIDSAPGEADECGVVFLALGSFPVVVGPADGIGSERGER